MTNLRILRRSCENDGSPALVWAAVCVCLCGWMCLRQLCVFTWVGVSVWVSCLYLGELRFCVCEGKWVGVFVLG